MNRTVYSYRRDGDELTVVRNPETGDLGLTHLRREKEDLIEGLPSWFGAGTVWLPAAEADDLATRIKEALHG